MNPVRAIAHFGDRGRRVLELMGRTLRVSPRVRPGAFVDALGQMALSALPLVGIAHFFAGMVIVLQSATELGRFGSNHLVGDIISLALVRELAPIFTALLMAGKAGAGLASELGMLTLSGQTQAMRALSIDIDRDVIAPKVIAVIWGTVLLTIAAILMGLLGGMLLSDAKLGISATHFLNRCIGALGPADFACGLIKAAAFGGIIAVVGVTAGLKAKRDAADLGRHTMQAVVTASFLVLVSDHVLTSLIVAVTG